MCRFSLVTNDWRQCRIYRWTPFRCTILQCHIVGEHIMSLSESQATFLTLESFGFDADLVQRWSSELDYMYVMIVYYLIWHIYMYMCTYMSFVLSCLSTLVYQSWCTQSNAWSTLLKFNRVDEFNYVSTLLYTTSKDYLLSSHPGIFPLSPNFQANFLSQMT